MITITSVAKTLLCVFLDSSMVGIQRAGEQQHYVTGAAWWAARPPLLPPSSCAVDVVAAAGAVAEAAAVGLRPQQLQRLQLLCRAYEAKSVVDVLWTC